MSRAHELAWAAGFFDGEGYITISRRNTKGYTGHYLKVGINHVNPKPLIEIQRLLGGLLKAQNPDKVIGNRKPRYSWSVSTSAAAEVLKQLMPYLNNKNEAAEIGLEFQKTVSKDKKKTSQEITDLREELKAKLQLHNSLD